jgi:hypothetical protein
MTVQPADITNPAVRKMWISAQRRRLDAAGIRYRVEGRGKTLRLVIEAPPAPRPPTAGNTAPVSHALELPKRTPGSAPLYDTVAAIDRVHTDGRLKEIPVKARKLAAHKGGAYAYYMSGAPDNITINTARTAQSQMLTLAHEIGHYLDHHGLGAVGRFASEAKDTPAWQAWRKAVQESWGYRHLTERPEPMKLSRAHTRYLLSNREAWARSYSQWLALRSGDPRMMAEAALRVAEDPTFHAGHWEWADFEPIAKAIDAIMEETGWIPSTP